MIQRDLGNCKVVNECMRKPLTMQALYATLENSMIWLLVAVQGIVTNDLLTQSSLVPIALFGRYTIATTTTKYESCQQNKDAGRHLAMQLLLSIRTHHIMFTAQIQDVFVIE